MSCTIFAETPWHFDPPPASTSRRGRAIPLSRRVSAIPDELLLAVEEDGLRAASVAELRGLLPSAQAWLSKVPDMERLVLDVVGDIHPLVAEPGYDVSHSQPQWRERIFVSCPERSDEVGALRLAESVIHEAMHLHLTNEEEISALVAVPTGKAHSPWREGVRPVQGVIHGLFVFTCIRYFSRALSSRTRLSEETSRYVEGRLATIDDEIAQVDVEVLSRSLTDRGRASVRFWLGRG